MVSPERRRPIDIVVSVCIVAVLAIVGATVWWLSPARRTVSSPAAQPAPAVVDPEIAPERFTKRWSTRSTASHVPQVAGSVVLVGADGTLSGVNPTSGRSIWSYQRDARLCSMLAWTGSDTNVALGVFANPRGCGEVTTLDSRTGRRTGGRSSLADSSVNLVTDGGYVVSQGASRLEVWGSNLVRGIEYGRVDAPVKPGVQPHEGKLCLIHSAAVAGTRVAVIERCDNEPGYRLSVVGAVLDKDEKVTQYGSSIITSGTSQPAPRLIAMSTSNIAVYDGGGNSIEHHGPTIRQFDSNGAPVTTSAVSGPVGPPIDSEPVTRSGVTTFWTGEATIVLDAASTKPLFQIDQTLGPGIIMGGQLLVPTADGITVRNAADGRQVRAIALERKDYRGDTISFGVLGGILYEQIGDTLTAYGAAR